MGSGDRDSSNDESSGLVSRSRSRPIGLAGEIPLRIHERLLYASGTIAFGVKDVGFSYWLLNYYNQCLGLSPARASTALFVALLFDAVFDVLIGHCSDNLRTVWGRRHPLMYASAIPTALCNLALWCPPASAVASQDRLFAWLLGASVLVRMSVSLNEIPSAALVAELTAGYDARTSLVALRSFFGWMGGVSLHVLLQTVLLHPSAPGARDAYFDTNGFHAFGAVGSGVMAISILVSAAAIHSRIPLLKQHCEQMAAPKPDPGGLLELPTLAARATQAVSDAWGPSPTAPSSPSSVPRS